MAAEIKSILHGTIEFSAINRELSIPIDISNINNIIDLKIQLYCAPSMVPLISSSQLTGGEDFRLYMNEHNVTSALIEELKILITEFDHPTLKKAYLNGAKAYLNLSKSLNIGLSPEQHEADYRKAISIADDENWGDKLSTLGNRDIGWSGNLHCFNFLYRFIHIHPISLNKVWNRHISNADNSLPRELSYFPHLVCTLSQGPAPSYEVFDPKLVHPSGRIVYQLELLHKNPLESRLRQISSKLKTIAKQLENQRVNYLTPIKTGVDTAKEDITLGNTEAKSALDRLKNALEQIG